MRELHHIDDASVVDWGHAITLSMAFVDESKETVKIPANLLGPLVLAINASAGIAGRTRLAQPGQMISVEVPLAVTRIDTGMMEDGEIALRVWIQNGPPLAFSLSRDLARGAIEFLSSELEKPEKPESFRPS